MTPWTLPLLSLSKPCLDLDERDDGAMRVPIIAVANVSSDACSFAVSPYQRRGTSLPPERSRMANGQQHSLAGFKEVSDVSMHACNNSLASAQRQRPAGRKDQMPQ